MKTVTIHAAKTNLSQLIAEAEQGEQIVIARVKQPVVTLTPVQPPKKKRIAGEFRGQIHIGPEFFEPMTEEELREWE
jgi:prevent-host-death family protein